MKMIGYLCIFIDIFSHLCYAWNNNPTFGILCLKKARSMYRPKYGKGAWYPWKKCCFWSPRYACCCPAVWARGSPLNRLLPPSQANQRRSPLNRHLLQSQSNQSPPNCLLSKRKSPISLSVILPRWKTMIQNTCGAYKLSDCSFRIWKGRRWLGLPDQILRECDRL